MSFFLLPRNLPGDAGGVVFSDVIEILESDMSKLSTMRLMNEEVQLLIGFDRLSKESIIDAKSYFKNYGFTLDIVDYRVDNKGKSTSIELSLLENDKAEKQKNRSKNYEMYNDGGQFDLVEFRKLSKEDKGMFLSIRANKKTGSHSVTLAHIPPIPPRPLLAPKAPKTLSKLPVSPKPSLAPKAPPKPPVPSVKVGMNNRQKWDKN